MNSQKVNFPNGRGESLSGILDTPKNEIRAWAVFAHCFTCSKASLAASRIARGLAEKDIGVLRFDFTGLGESEGDFSANGFSSNVDDLKAAISWMEAEGRPVSLMIGHSLGGAATVVAAEQLHQIKAVVAIGAPSDADHVIAQFEEKVPEIEERGEARVDLAGRAFTLRKSFIEDVRGARVRDAAKHLNRPLLILHSPIDSVVGIENATGLFVAAKHPKSFISLGQADHLITRQEDTDFAVSIIVAWAQTYFEAPLHKREARTQAHDVLVRETGKAGPYQNEIFIDGQRFLADEPTSMGGAGSGPNPYAWVTAGLGACTSMTLRMYAERKNWPLDRVTVHLDYAKKHLEDCVDCKPSDKIDVFTRQILIEGDLTDEQRERLLEIADRCPVHRTLENGAVIETVDATKLA